MKKLYSLLLILFVCTKLIYAQGCGDATIGFVMTSLNRGETIFATNPNKAFTPASITKLITTATSLAVLGDDFRFKTEVFACGKIEDGVLKGNIVIVAGGDPTINSAYFDDNTDLLTDICDAISHFGIKKVDGDIVADVSIFDSQALPSGWDSPDVGNYYAAGIYGLSFYDNMVAVSFRSSKAGTKPQIISFFPPIDGFEVDNRLTAKKGVGDNAYFSGRPYINRRKVTGEIEANNTRFIVKADLGNPPKALIEALMDSLVDRNIIVRGSSKISFASVPRNDTFKMILSYYSPKLLDIVRQTNHHSINMFAEALVKQLSLRESKKGSFDGGLKVIKKYWKSKGLDVETLNIKDGSGLTVTNTFSPKMLNDMLKIIYSDKKLFDSFLQTLPRAGREGTVRKLLKGTRLEGKAYLKSGSISGVQCYAGYIIDGNNSYSLVVMANNIVGRRRNCVAEIERLILNKMGY